MVFKGIPLHQSNEYELWKYVLMAGWVQQLQGSLARWRRGPRQVCGPDASGLIFNSIIVLQGCHGHCGSGKTNLLKTERDIDSVNLHEGSSTLRTHWSLSNIEHHQLITLQRNLSAPRFKPGRATPFHTDHSSQAERNGRIMVTDADELHLQDDFF